MGKSEARGRGEGGLTAVPRRPRAGVLVAAGLAAIVAAHLPALAGPFLWDDRELIVESPAARELQPIGRYFTSTFWEPTPNRPTFAGYYRPLVSLSYALQYQAHGEATPGYHLFNLAFHLAAVMLLYLLARRLGAGVVPALLAMLAWGLFPRLTECVDWISGRTDLMAGAFALGALLTWDGGSPRRRWGAALLLALGLFSKEVALAVLPALAARELWALRGQPGWQRALAMRLAPPVLAVAAWASLRAVALAAAPSPVPQVVAPLVRFTQPLEALGTYAVMLLDFARPASLIGVAGRSTTPHIALGTAMLAGAVALAAVAWRRFRPATAMALALAGAALLPVLHILRIQVQVVAADRFLYLPLAGLALALAVGASAWTSRARRVAGLAAAALVAVSLPVTYGRATDYSDEGRFWLAEARRAPPEFAIPRAQLGAMLFREGRFAAAAKLFHAALADMRRLEYFQQEVINMLEVNIALCLTQLDQRGPALQLMDALVAGQPGVAGPWFDRAQVKLAGQDWAGARADLAEALRLFPEFERARRAERLGAWAQKAWEALPPPEAPNQTTRQLADRARILARTEARMAASRLWSRVLEAPDATAEDRRNATAYLARLGPPERARQAAAAYSASGAADAPLLQELLELRLQRLAELDEVQRALGI